MTAEPKRTKRPAPKKGGGDVTVTILQSTDPNEVREHLAATCDGWDRLPEVDKGQLVTLMIDQISRPTAIEVDLTIDPAGKPNVSLGGVSPTATAFRMFKLMNGSSNASFNARLNDVLRYLKGVNSQNANSLNAALQFVENMKPQDQAQTALLFQAYATHDSAMRALANANQAGLTDHVRLYGNLANKLLTTFTKQMETLMRMQRGNEQVIRHVYVDNRGGQAVIAENIATGGAGAIPGQQPFATPAIGGSAPMLGADPFGNGLPIAGDPWPQAMPDARRSVTGCANGIGERELQARPADQGGNG
jgi:hypothetical protein